jgi:hypothetical protein
MYFSKINYLGIIIVAMVFVNIAVAQEVTFSEKRWSESVESTDVADLYKPHFKDGRFFNSWMPMPERGFLEVMKWRFFMEKENFSDEEEKYLPVSMPDVVGRIKSFGDKDFVIWIGHATALIRVNNTYFLLDPIFSKRAAVPSRHTPPAVTIEELLTLNVPINVLLTHNHYDHLDNESMSKLPAGTVVYAPLGLSEVVSEMNKKDVREMDWWESIDCGNGIKVHAVPAQHWC